MSNYKTQQEAFWAGAFGDEYTDRNAGAALVASNVALFSRILARCRDIQSVFEVGANAGMNLLALHQLLPQASLEALEINPKAADRLRALPFISKVHNESILEFKPGKASDLAFIKGVLIHISPDSLAEVYQRLAALASRYVMICEYYNPSPVAIPYRGHEGKLFKRDFAGEFLDAHKEFHLLDYGFVYHRDPVFPADDITWFLLERK